ncbi:hypothetical protein [Streptomyces sp. CC219B]|nr:hypothetical protein [Streptomyces sp. CC219B]
MEQNPDLNLFAPQTDEPRPVSPESGELIEIRLLDKIETIQNKAVSR